MRYYPIIMHTIDARPETERHAHLSADRFEKLNGIRPRVVTRADIEGCSNKYWYSAWVWDFVPANYDYVFFMDSKVLPIRRLPELPELKFAAALDRHDRIKHGMRYSELINQTGKYYQMHVFFAHRDTQPAFEELKKLNSVAKYNTRGNSPAELGFDGRGNFTPMNEVIQAAVPVHELSHAWNWIITYEKQFYYTDPYMINFVANEYGTWAYFKFVRDLMERLEAAGGSLDSENTPVNALI